MVQLIIESSPFLWLDCEDVWTEVPELHLRNGELAGYSEVKITKRKGPRPGTTKERTSHPFIAFI